MLVRTTFLAALLAFASPGAVDVAPLFDGESLAGWTAIGGRAGNWRAGRGLLVAGGDGKGWLSTNRAFADFVLRLEYRTGRGGNSGALIRAPHRGDPSFDGLEIQILDDDAPAHRGLRPDQYTGSIYGVVAARRGHARPTGTWNEMEIRAEGSRVRVELNGVEVLAADLDEIGGDLGRHVGVRRRSGYLGLQSHESRVEFRNLTIRELRRPSEALAGEPSPPRR